MAIHRATSPGDEARGKLDTVALINQLTVAKGRNSRIGVIVAINWRELATRLGELTNW